MRMTAAPARPAALHSHLPTLHKTPSMCSPARGRIPPTVHNDIKPANLLLGARSSSQPSRLHLIDFGSATRVDGYAGADGEIARPNGAIGTVTFASVAADDSQLLMRPADDIESLVYTLTYLAAGSLPWRGKPEQVANQIKCELLAGSGEAARLWSLADHVHCAATVAALEDLWVELRRCHGGGRKGAAGASVDYDACLAALGGGSFEVEAEEADLLSECDVTAAICCRSSEAELEGAAAPGAVAAAAIDGA